MPTYTPARPGRRPKRCTTAAERRNFVAANTRKRCSAVGCSSLRKWTSSYCSNHKGRVATHGHPEGGRLDAGLVETYRLRFAKWLDLYEDTPQVRAALEVMEALLRGALVKRRSYAQRELRRLREGERHPGDHATGPTTAREALEVVGGVYWLSLYRPDELHDDVRLSTAPRTRCHSRPHRPSDCLEPRHSSACRSRRWCGMSRMGRQWCSGDLRSISTVTTDHRQQPFLPVAPSK